MKLVSTHIKDKPLPGFSSSSTEIISLAINASGNRTAHSRTDKSVRVWRYTNGRFSEPTTIEDAHYKPVESISWDPRHDQQFATVGRDEYIKIWRASGRCDRQIKGKGQFKFVQFDPSGKSLVAVDRDGHVVVYETHSYTLIGEADVESSVYDVQWLNSVTFCVALQNATIKVFRQGDGIQLLGTLSGHMSSVTTCCSDPRGKFLAAGSNEGVVSLWDTESMLNTGVLTQVDEAISCVSASSDGSHLAVAYDAGSNIMIYNVASREKVFEVPNSESGEATFPAVAWFPNMVGILYSGDNGRSAMMAVEEE